MSTKNLLLGTLGLILLLPVVAGAQEPRAGLIDAVARTIASYPRYTVFDHVTFSVDGSAVTLHGKVTMPIKKDEIEGRVAKIDGVETLRNEIDVLPVSPFDDRLRRKASRAIYGNANFWGYAARANPPIHIVVEHGRVTLAGVVATEVDRALAQALATGLGEFSVTNHLQVESARR